MDAEIQNLALFFAELAGADVSAVAPTDYQIGRDIERLRILSAKFDPRMLDSLDRGVASTAMLLGLEPPKLPPISQDVADEYLTRALGFDTTRWQSAPVPSDRPGYGRSVLYPDSEPPPFPAS